MPDLRQFALLFGDGHACLQIEFGAGNHVGNSVRERGGIQQAVKRGLPAPVFGGGVGAVRQQEFDQRRGSGEMENGVAELVGVIGIGAVLQQHGGLLGVACLDLVIERRLVVGIAAEIGVYAVVKQPLHQSGRGVAHCQWVKFSAAALGGVDVGVGIDGLQGGDVACLAEFAEVFGEGGFLFGHGASFVGWGGFQAALNGVGGGGCAFYVLFIG